MEISFSVKIDSPDFSDKGNKRDKNSCIRPQKTVFCDFDSLRNKSTKRRHKNVFKRI